MLGTVRCGAACPLVIRLCKFKTFNFVFGVSLCFPLNKVYFFVFKNPTIAPCPSATRPIPPCPFFAVRDCSTRVTAVPTSCLHRCRLPSAPFNRIPTRRSRRPHPPTPTCPPPPPTSTPPPRPPPSLTCCNAVVSRCRARSARSVSFSPSARSFC